MQRRVDLIRGLVRVRERESPVTQITRLDFGYSHRSVFSPRYTKLKIPRVACAPPVFPPFRFPPSRLSTPRCLSYSRDHPSKAIHHLQQRSAHSSGGGRSSWRSQCPRVFRDRRTARMKNGKVFSVACPCYTPLEDRMKPQGNVRVMFEPRDQGNSSLP